MFKNLFELWHREDLLQQSFDDAVKMLEMAEDIYKKAVAPFFGTQTVEAQEIYNIDQKINHFEISIRRKVLEHISISAEQDTTAALVLTTISVDIERIGDYAKNFMELWELYGKSLTDIPMFDRLEQICNNILKMFENTISSFKNADSETALKVMELHVINSKNCEEIIAALVRTPTSTKSFDSNQEVLVALAARYFKRTSAHLKNIASSTINPFDRIGYKPNSETEYTF